MIKEWNRKISEESIANVLILKCESLGLPLQTTKFNIWDEYTRWINKLIFDFGFVV